jgi:hypothetical protein
MSAQAEENANIALWIARINAQYALKVSPIHAILLNEKVLHSTEKYWQHSHEQTLKQLIASVK